MEKVQCELCRELFDDFTTLSVHQQFDSCAERIQCPLCGQGFADSHLVEIHFNEIHDQSSRKTTVEPFAEQLAERQKRMRTHYEHENKNNETETINVEDEDAMIARLLQEEEEAQSFQEFRNRYGANSRTFKERARWNLEKLLQKKMISKSKFDEYIKDLDQMIAQPIERAESRTSSEISFLFDHQEFIVSIFIKDLIQQINRLPMGNVRERRLCRPSCDHFSATWLDQGWACGYKNFQMLLSSLANDRKYATHLFGHEPTTNTNIPSVSYLQTLIEKAWGAGFDSDGREQLNGSLVNSTKWIGPTEIIACLANLNIKTELFEFHQPKTLHRSIAYEYLFKWIRNYFQKNDNDRIHPLYLQHQGHSRTIVGYEQFPNGNIRLIIFDPSTSKNQIDYFIRQPSNRSAHIFRRSLASFQKPVYQILAVQGLLEVGERERAKRIYTTNVPFPH